MKLLIAYEVGGAERNYTSKELNVEDEENYSDIITRNDIVQILTRASIEITSETVLSYYNEPKYAYETLKENQQIPSAERLKILIRKPQHESIEALNFKIREMEKKVKELTKIVESSENQSSSVIASRSTSYMPRYSELDIAMIHGCPLAMIGGENVFALEEANLNFEAERRSLIEYLERKETGVNIRFEVATTENLRDLLEYKPKVLYFSGQSFAKSLPVQEFVLAFEKTYQNRTGNIEIGVLDEINAEALRKILNNAPQYFQVVIVKGCYAQEMANVFLNAGFNCIVAIQDSKNEAKAQKFIAEFCRNLLIGESVKKSFQKAQIQAEDNSPDMHCCCAHLHKPTCKWMKEIKLSNSSDLHEEHILTRCKGKNNLHEIYCKLGMAFNEKYCQERKPTDEEDENDQWRICCCSPELEHTNLKYSMMYSDESVLDQVLFGPLKKLAIEVHCPLPTHLKPPYMEKVTFGRRLEIRDLITLAMTNRCVNVTGSSGIGKSDLVKVSAQYAYDRWLFKDGVVYLDFLNRTDIIFLYRFISNTLNLPSYSHYKDLCTALYSLDILMILDNIDPLLKHDKKAFTEVYLDLIHNTRKPTFIIVTQEKLNLENCLDFNVPPLTLNQATKFMQSLIGKNEFDVQNRFSTWDFGNKPSEILQNSALSSKTPQDKASPLENLLKKIYILVPNSEKLLNLLSYLPSGAYNFNLEYLCKGLGLVSGDLMTRLQRVEQTTTLLHVEDNFEFILLKSDVANYLEAHVHTKENYTLDILTHLGLFSRGILKALMHSKQEIGSDIRCSLFFINAGMDKHMWAARFGNSSIIENKIYDPIAMFKRIETSFWHYISISRLQKLLNTEKTLPEIVEDSLGEIMICSASIFILLGNNQDALEILAKGKACCEAFGMDLYLNMLRLIEASIYASIGESYKVDEILKFVIEYCENSKNDEGLAEAFFLKGLGKDNCEECLEKAHQLFGANLDSLGCARSKLALAEYSLKSPRPCEETLPMLENAARVFKNAQLFNWQARTLICLSDVYLKLDIILNARDILIAADALPIIRKSPKQKTEISSKISKVNDVIRKTKKNSISLLKAFPLVEKNSSISRAGASVRFTSNFRIELQKKLKTLKNEICVRMDVASREKLKQCLEEKCVALHFSSEHTSNSHLYFEKENGVADPISTEELCELVGGNLHQHGVKLLVLAIPFSADIGEYCKKSLGVSHVVCFNMPEYPKDGDPVQIYISFETAIQHFCIEFYANLVGLMTVRNAFLSAKESMEKVFTQKAKEFAFLEIRDRSFHEWWTGHHKNEPILINESSSEHDQCLFTSAPGLVENCLIEMSNFRGPCNVTRNLTNSHAFIGRQVEIYNTISSLSEIRCVHVYGVEGVGKTEFVNEVAYYLNVRNKYPDGIFLLDLAGKSLLTEVYQLFKGAGLGFHSSDINPRTFLNDKKLLLILENCEALYTKAVHTFHEMLKMFLHECKISVILTSSIHIQAQETIEMRRFSLRHMSRMEGHMLLSLNSPGFTSQLLDSEEDKKNYTRVIDKILDKCLGLAKNIKNQSVVLEQNKTRDLSSWLYFMRFRENTDLRGGPEMKRSITMHQNFNKFEEGPPRLNSGRSSYTGELIPLRTSHY